MGLWLNELPNMPHTATLTHTHTLVDLTYPLSHTEQLENLGPPWTDVL